MDNFYHCFPCHSFGRISTIIISWILFLILRTQENAKAAYLEPTGQLIMLFGVLATIAAYIWMNKIANLPKSKRLFTMQMIEK